MPAATLGKTQKEMGTPCQMPNGLQWTDEGLFVMDQLTDNVYLLDERGRVLRTIHTVTENGSGITVGGGYIWTASNGRTVSRPYRSTDTHLGYIYKLDMKTGEAVDRFRTPDGGGLHGLEWDNGLLWVTQFNPKALVLVDPKKGFRVIHKFEVDLPRAHGLARDGAGIWCAFTGIRTIVKYNVETGREMDRIQIGDDGPYPHGLSINDGVLWYCDADFPKDRGTSRGWPEIGTITMNSRASATDKKKAGTRR
jgi:hypothetical protein